MNHFNGKVNLGVVVRWQDNDNLYKALINGTQLDIIKRVNGANTTIGSMHFQAQDGVIYSLRLRAIGAMLFAKVWPSNTTEPTTWMLTIPDTSFASGQVGLRVVVQNTSLVKVTSFMATIAGSTM
jgi:hypothetical protein